MEVYLLVTLDENIVINLEMFLDEHDRDEMLKSFLVDSLKDRYKDSYTIDWNDLAQIKSLYYRICDEVSIGYACNARWLDIY